MKTVNQLVEKLYKEARHKMVEKIGNHNSYKVLVKDLLVQVFPIYFLLKFLLNVIIGSH